ncbi:hypothetical protein BX600DRAFT_441111 [Xylariales sp. PMI_506]|nr:hypothetical protein BX600DRAFT_441111 [Xylariales sp. PMI_506]
MVSETVNLHGIRLPPRYEIRPIQPEHARWCRALLIQGLVLSAPVWRPVIPEPKVKTMLGAVDALEPFYRKALSSGLSYALFDTQYQFKRPESAAGGGALYWDEIDPEDPELEAKGEQWMLDKMDFPIVGLALSYDDFDRPSPESFGSMAALAPIWGDLMAQNGKMLESAGLPTATAPGQYVHRSGCVTRWDYQGKGLAKAFSWWVMLELEARGYQGITVGAGNELIGRIWLHPDAPFASKACINVPIGAIGVEFQGEMVYPFKDSPLTTFQFILCDLKAKNPNFHYEVRE